MPFLYIIFFILYIVGVIVCLGAGFRWVNFIIKNAFQSIFDYDDDDITIVIGTSFLWPVVFVIVIGSFFINMYKNYLKKTNHKNKIEKPDSLRVLNSQLQNSIDVSRRELFTRKIYSDELTVEIDELRTTI